MPINVSDDNPRIREFLRNFNVGVLATASRDGLPHAATIYFTTESDYSVYFVTKQKTTKSSNLQDNPRAALAVFDAATQTTVQVAGDVEIIEDVEEVQRLFSIMLTISHQTSDGHQPPISKLDAGKYVAYRLKPQVVRMAEFIKAEYPPVDALFEVVTPPDTSL
ncbi:MAG: pyridoxamine 5'-phosphate oxidase family protein [Patescibacteria group bacterium]|nr:pyridoxamine 5'-phosphate oxidase family protein [Patescibacteria group bacterium]